jgi:hypothetical protein
MHVCQHESSLTLASSITRVLTTSNGVVNIAAVAPATDPQAAASAGDGLFPSKYRFDNCRFSPSYNGN